MSMRDLIVGEAELDDEENDEDFDEETGEERPRKARHVDDEDDSSEEEEDDDPDEMAKVHEGFIVDEEDEEPEERDRRRRDRKRRRAEREEEEAVLDEEDLDLIGESRPDWERKSTTQKFKRLKRGNRDDSDSQQERGLDDIFSDEDDGLSQQPDRHYRRGDTRLDEFADFIEEDDLEDDAEKQARQEEMEIARPRERGFVNTEASGIDKEAVEEMEQIFGNGEDYDWALEMEEEAERRDTAEHDLELKDVFEPSQLVEKMLTEEDNIIRSTDNPERFQLDRRPFQHVEISDEQFKEEARWIASLIWPNKQLSRDLHNPFIRAVGKVLEFFVIDDVEVPYVFQHRKDYLIHASTQAGEDAGEPGKAEKLLNQDDLWRILELDLKFRALIDKRNILSKLFDNLKAVAEIKDEMFETMLPLAVTLEELQDLQDYIYFQYGQAIRDLAATNGTTKTRQTVVKRSIYDRIRNSRAYFLVKSFGISVDDFALNALKDGRKNYAEDPSQLPIDLADSLTNDEDFRTGAAVLNAARDMFAEEIVMSPRMRKHFRINYYQMGCISCFRTKTGLRAIDEQHQYYELKYLKDQTFGDMASNPELFLKMLKAEEDGLLEIRITLQNDKEFRRQLLSEFASDNYSELADAWNDERKKVLDIAITKLGRVITKGVKESLRTACQEAVLKHCREEYLKKLDQAPYKPKGMVLGTIPRAFTLSNGNGDPNRDPVAWTWVDEDGRVMDNGKVDRLLRDERSREILVELVRRRRPDVIGVSGWSADTQKLVIWLRNLVEEADLRGPEFEDLETGLDRSELLEVVVVNDEVARLYKESPRAATDYPSLGPLTRYTAALAKYLQNPLKEYAALGDDIVSIAFHPVQQLLPADKFRKALDSAMVDLVNLCGVDINDALGDPYTAALLPYVCGLGIRKAPAVLKIIGMNGGVVNTREELVGDPDSGKLPVVGPKVWNNCASFLFIEYDSSNATSEYLDNTRVHPEDYELGRKMAADALELDEEDVKAEVEDGGSGAVVRRLMKEGEQDKVNDLILEEYAEQLEAQYNQRKRATLENIRAEMQTAFEELRHSFAILSDEEIFTMFTGETRDTLSTGMTVSVNVRVVKDDFMIVRLDSGIEGRIEIQDGLESQAPFSQKFSHGQTTQTKVLHIDYRNLTASLSVNERRLREVYQRVTDRDRDPIRWDVVQEQADKEELREKDRVSGRATRVVKHPLFRPFNSIQAEEYLGSQAPGDAVIRPSSKGNDHLAITWKVADGVYQHLDVLELEKDNEFSVGRVLRVGGKYNYSDLDELIVDHVKAMAKKVDEMMQHEKYQAGSKTETENWLKTYTEANPKRSVYAFCIDTKHPGYFWLCFKAGKFARENAWSIRIVPNAFELMKTPYPDMKALCNGFKIRHQAESNRGR